LANVEGLNSFVACVILSQVDLERFLDMSPQSRIDNFGEILSVERMVRKLPPPRFKLSSPIFRRSSMKSWCGRKLLSNLHRLFQVPTFKTLPVGGTECIILVKDRFCDQRIYPKSSSSSQRFGPSYSCPTEAFVKSRIAVSISVNQNDPTIGQPIFTPLFVDLHRFRL
jgi:hypothetical protein